MLNSLFDESLCTSPTRPFKPSTLKVVNKCSFHHEFDKLKSITEIITLDSKLPNGIKH